LVAAGGSSGRWSLSGVDADLAGSDGGMKKEISRFV
jgi:hypothetical protein